MPPSGGSAGACSGPLRVARTLLDLERHLGEGEPDVPEHVILRHAQVTALVGPVLPQQQPSEACDERPSGEAEGQANGFFRLEDSFHMPAWKSTEERGSRRKILVSPEGEGAAAGTGLCWPFSAARRGVAGVVRHRGAPGSAENAWKALEKFGAGGISWDIPRGSPLRRGCVAATGTSHPGWVEDGDPRRPCTRREVARFGISLRSLGSPRRCSAAPRRRI